MLSDLKMRTSLFVKSVYQPESHSCLIGRMLTLFRFGCAWNCVAAGGNVGRYKWPESVGLNNGFFREAESGAVGCWL